MIRYSMNGEDLGEVTEEKVHELLSGGKIDHSAFFWREGMLEWRPIAELLGKLEIAGELEQKSGKPPMKPTKNEPTKTQIKKVRLRPSALAISSFPQLTQARTKPVIQGLKNPSKRQKSVAVFHV